MQRRTFLQGAISTLFLPLISAPRAATAQDTYLDLVLTDSESTAPEALDLLKDKDTTSGVEYGA